MKKTQEGQLWYFVDESGDPTFYDHHGNLIVGQEGCSPILILGFVETQFPEPVRRSILDLQKTIVDDPYFQDFPSIKKTAVAFHAKDDLPEIRYEFFKLLAQQDFQAQVVVARKIERVFRNAFHARENDYYDHLVTELFQKVLHRYQMNHIYFSKRGSRDRQSPLIKALKRGTAKLETRHSATVGTKYSFQAQTPQGEPILSAIDYINWAVYRAFTRGDMGYYRVIENKIRLLVDLYDVANYPRNWYSRKNPFDIKKITPL